MRILATGDILKADQEALINTVNCVGVMGKGVALQFKKAFPENFRAYEKACKRGLVVPGQMFVYETGRATNPKYIINFPTKRHWRDKSWMSDIESGLTALTTVIKERNIKSIAMPALGCGLGGLDWGQVKVRIAQAMAALPNVDALVYEPSRAVPQIPELLPVMTAGRAALITLVERYQRAVVTPFVTLLEVHKLLYFLQEAGEPLNLEFKKAVYGPYSQNLRQVLRKIEGHFISGYADAGDKPNSPIAIKRQALKPAEAFLQAFPMTQARSERVAQLVQGFESPFGLELLATVHWLVTKEKVASLPELIEQTYQWGPQKEKFNPSQIEAAMETLSKHQWTATQQG